jgi:hypothetical protein
MRNAPYTIEELDKKPEGKFLDKFLGNPNFEWKNKLSVETIEQVKSGKPISDIEFNKMRGNSYDWKTRYPLLDNKALIKRTQYTLDNCGINDKGRFTPNTTYDEALYNSLVPILMDRLEESDKVLREVLKEQEWARMTYKDKLKFGMPEDQAIKSRERRYNGVFMTSIRKIKELLNIR